MRYMLYDSNTEKIDLSSEIEFIKDYIALQKLRIKNQEAVETEFNGQFKNLLVPPMLFIPFIENAFKHCSDTTINKDTIFPLNFIQSTSSLKHAHIQLLKFLDR